MISRSYLIFIGFVFALSTTLTICLAAILPETAGATEYLLVKEDQGGRMLFPVLDGADHPLPFAKPITVSSRTVVVSSLIYAVSPGATLRDWRYPTYWR